MSGDDDFAAMLEQSLAGDQHRPRKELRKGERVEGTVVAVGAEYVFVDIGQKSEGRIARSELEDDKTGLKVEVGDSIRGTVANPNDPEGPLVRVALGGHGVDTASLELAAETGTPVEGRISAAVKAGLEVQIGRVRAFCPASQVDLAYVADLDVFVGQSHFFKVLEVRDRGRSVVVSRKAILAEEREKQAGDLMARLEEGTELEGIVDTIKPYGAFVDLGGVRGLVHVSELAHSRVTSPEDVVSVGETVRVRVLSVQSAASSKARDMKVSLSMKALQQPPPQAKANADQVFPATVQRIESFGLLVDTAEGSGLVPNRELDLPHGSDVRRAFKSGDTVEVVLMGKDGQGRPRFSIKQVAEADARREFRSFREKSGKSSGKLGSLGDLLQGIDLSAPKNGN